MNISKAGQSTDCSSDRDTNVHPGPAWTPAVWTGPLADVGLPGEAPHPHQHAVHPGVMDPLTFSTGPGPGPGPDPGPPHSSRYSSSAAPWFINEPIHCSMMPDDFLAPLDSIYEPLAKSLQQFQERQTVATPHITQPVLCNVRGHGDVAPVKPCDPGPVFLTLKSAAAYREDSLAGDFSSDRDTNVHPGPAWTPAVWTGPPADVGLPGEAPHPHQHAVHPGVMDPLTFRTTGILRRKPCHCSKSHCLKLYCECFANGVMCSDCCCFNCHNNSEHEVKRHKAMESYLGRNPGAFRSKIVGGMSGEVKGWHYKGCSCKRSGCLKNYCECFEANIKCTSSCKCAGCSNCGDGPQTSLSEEAVNLKTRCPVLISGAQVEATCRSLLVRAQQAKREDKNHIQTERMVLEEFGKCLTQIRSAMLYQE